MKEHTLTQKEQIRRYLETGYEVNHMIALKLFGCARLAARINDLRAEGVPIESRIVHNRINGKHYAVYSFRKVGPESEVQAA